MAENQAGNTGNKREQDQALFGGLFRNLNGGDFFAQIMMFLNSLFAGLSGGLDGISNLFKSGGATIRRGIDSGRELIGEGIDALKNLIGHHESGNDYNRVYGVGIKRIPLDQMSVNQVLAWQRDYVNKGSPSSAVGKYQIIQDTLRGLKTEMGLTGNEKMDEDLQDRMFEHLARRRGLDDFLAGKISKERMMYNLSREWASLPKNGTGLSYYHGDGLNRAHATPDSVLRALEKVAESTTESTVRFAQAERTGKTLETTPNISSQMNKSSAKPEAPAKPAPYIPTIASTVEKPAPEKTDQLPLISPSLAFS